MTTEGGEPKAGQRLGGRRSGEYIASDSVHHHEITQHMYWHAIPVSHQEAYWYGISYVIPVVIPVPYPFVPYQFLPYQ